MFLRLHIYVSEIRLGFIHLGILFIVYVTFIRLIVLYSRCRVNRSTNLFVFLYDVINFCFCFHCGLGSVWAFPTCGVRPHSGYVHSITTGFGAEDSASFQPPRTLSYLSPSLGASRVGCSSCPT